MIPKKGLSILLVSIMVVTMIPAFVLAEDEDLDMESEEVIESVNETDTQSDDQEPLEIEETKEDENTEENVENSEANNGTSNENSEESLSSNEEFSDIKTESIPEEKSEVKSAEDMTDTTNDGHDHIMEEKTDANYVGPTCYDWGYWLLHCTVDGCQYSHEYQDIENGAPLPHSWTYKYEWAEDHSTCTATFACSKCGQGFPVTAQSTHLTKPAKCEQDGYYRYSVSFAGYGVPDGVILERQIEDVTIPATGHNFVDGVCTNKNCGKTEDEVSSQSEETEDTRETETKETVDQNTCNHLFDADTCVVVTQPTCVDTGLSTITCSECGYVKEIVLPATGEHSYRTMTKKATCQKEGTKTTVCAVCKDTKVETLPKIDHNFVLNEDGTKYVCSMCGEEKAVENEKNHVHDYKEEIIKEATCTADGTKKYTCSCGDSYTETIKAGHKFEITEEEAATCETCGHTVKVCSLCGKKQTESRTPLGHDFKNGVCTRCGKKSTECSHTWGEPTVTWSDDYSTATAVWHCTKNSSHTISETVDSVKMKEVSPTKCMTRGYIIYDAFFYKGSTKIASVSVPTKEFLWHDDEPISYIDPSECPTTYEMSFKCARCGKITKTYFTSSAHQFKNGRCIKCGTYESDVKATSGSTSESASANTDTAPSSGDSGSTSKVTNDATVEKTCEDTESIETVRSSENETDNSTSSVSNESTKKLAEYFESEGFDQSTAQRIATLSEAYDSEQTVSKQADVSQKGSASKTLDSTDTRIGVLEKTIVKLVSEVQKLTDLLKQLLGKLG